MTVTPFHDRHSLGPVDSLFLVVYWVYLSNICIERFQVPKMDVLTYDTAAKGKTNTYIHIQGYYVIQNCKPKSLGIHTWVCESVYLQKTAALFLTLTNILVIMHHYISLPAPTGL